MKLLFALLTGPGKIRTGVRYDGPEAIERAEKAQKDDSRPMKDMGERLRGDSSMTKNHTPRRYMTKKMIDYMTEVIRDTVLAHGEAVPAWLLVKVITRLGEVGAGFAEEGPEEVKVKRFEASPQLIYRDEDGCKYKTKVEISHGKPNRYMKAAHDQYGKNSRWLQVPYTNAEDANKQKSIFAQAGANRQGIATWGAWIDNGNITTDSMTSTMIYNYYGLPSVGMIANEWARTGVTESLLSILNNTTSGTYFRDFYNLDLLTNINSRFSTHSFYNSQEFSDVNIKVYVCQAKAKNFNAIWTDVAPFGGSTTDDFKVPKYSPAADVTASYTQPIKATGAGFNWFDNPDAIEITYTDNAGTGTASDDIKVETSTVLGLTPQQSQVFKANWEVLDVLDNTIGPNDTWEVHLEQKFNKSHSVRSWYEAFNKIPAGEEAGIAIYDNILKQTQKGDVVLLTVFSGMPASNYVLDGTDQKNSIPVDAGPSRIRHEVRHGINVSWPEPLQPLDINEPDLVSPSFTEQGWNVVKQKTNYTDRPTYDYDRGEIKVSTRSNIEDDKSKSSAGT